MRRLLPCSVLIVAALSAGCTDDSDPAGGSEETSASPSQAPSETADETSDESETTGEGPVAGSGAALPPKRRTKWCGAVTADQLNALTGYEVARVRGDGRQPGLVACSAELPDLELQITWGSVPAKKSFEQYAATWDRPAGVFDVTDVELPNGQPAVVATQPVPETGHAGTVVDGQLIQVLVGEVIPDEGTTVEDLGAMAETILAVYAG